MTQSIRITIVAAGLAAALTGGAWGRQAVLAQGGTGAGAVQGAAQGAAPGAAQKQNKNGNERHPVLKNSMRQLENIKDRLQKAPTDFGGHREKAVDAITHAISELQQAIQFDSK
jgi:hypothetical protein